MDVLRDIWHPLFESTESLDRQLAALRRRCGGSAGGSLPTAAQLQVAWAVLTTQLAPVGLRYGLPHAVVATALKQGARELLALQPDNPRSSYELAKAIMESAAAGLALRPRDAVRLYQRGAELARAQGSDYWLARWAVR